MAGQPEMSLVEERAGELAKWYGADYQQTLAALQRLVDEDFPSRVFPQGRLPEEDAIHVAASVLASAFSALPWKLALRFLRRFAGQRLADCLRVSSGLAGVGCKDGTLLFSSTELASALGAFRQFLAADREHLLRTGLLSKPFGPARWLQTQLGKLYPVRSTTNIEPFGEDDAAVGRSYRWIKLVPHELRLGVDQVAVGGDEADDLEGSQAADTAELDGLRLGVDAVEVEYGEADVLEGFQLADVVELERLREPLLDLKLAVLAHAQDALRSPDSADLWSLVLPHLVATLTADQVEFLSRMDTTYRSPPAGSLSPYVAVMLGHRVALEPGGLGNLIDLIGHVQRECKIGTMHRAREALGDLVVASDRGPALPSTGPWPYFDFFTSEHERQAIDNAIDIVVECEAEETTFWTEFESRAASALAQEFDREVTITVRAKGTVAEGLKDHVLHYAEFAKSHMELSGKLPVLQLQQQAAAEAEAQNVFRQSDEGWSLRYNGGPAKLLLPMSGFLYIQVLLETPNTGHRPEDLYARNPKPVHCSRSLLPAEAAETNQGNLPAKADCYIDQQTLREIRQRLDEIPEELERAASQRNDAETERLHNERQKMLEYLKSSARPGGLLATRATEAKNCRDRVRIAIERAVDKIKSSDDALYQHLLNSVKYREQFSYEPDRNIAWNS